MVSLCYADKKFARKKEQYYKYSWPYYSLLVVGANGRQFQK